MDTGARKRKHDRSPDGKSKKKRHRQGRDHSNLLTLRFDDTADPVPLASWTSTGAPVAELADRLDIRLKSKEQEEEYITAVDSHSKVNFIGEDDTNAASSYFVGVRVGKELVIKRAKVFTMKPSIKFEEDSVPKPVVTLSKKEQMDELNEKFGSKQSKRLLAEKRKYAVEIDEEYLDELLAEKTIDGQNTTTTAEGTPTTPTVHKVEVLPNRDDSATSASEVYDISSIVSEEAIALMKTIYPALELKSQINNDEIWKLVSKRSEDDQYIGLYLSVMVALHRLKYAEFNRNDPLGKSDLAELSQDIKNLVYDQFCTTKEQKLQIRRALPEQEKDKLLAHCIVLFLYMKNFAPVELTVVTALVKTTLPKMKKLAVHVGCYVEKKTKNSKGINCETMELRLPLNKLHEPRVKKPGFKRL